MCKKLLQFFLLVIVLLFFFFLIFGVIDINRFDAGKNPLFVVRTEMLNDGGTQIHYGIGYQLIEWKKIDDENIDSISYLVGRESHAWFEMINPVDGPTIELEKER